jgi:hypothetical protein
MRQTIGAVPQFELSSEDAFLRSPGSAPIWVRKQSFQVSHKTDTILFVMSHVWIFPIYVSDRQENPQLYFVSRPNHIDTLEALE